ncbi:hypothetical protein AAC387_Pa06g2792 [Persea americana]
MKDLRMERFFRSERRKTGNCSFTAALIGGNVDFPVFLRSERRKAGNCSFTTVLIGGKVDFPVFLRSERRKTGNCHFTAVLIGGKVDFPVFLRSERRKTGNCSFTAVLIEGKVDFPVFLRSRGGKLEIAASPLLSSAVQSIFQFSSAPSGAKQEIAELRRVHMAEIFRSDFLSFFPFFCLLVGHGSWLSSAK